MQRKERGGKEGKRKMEGVWCVTKAAGDKHRTGESSLPGLKEDACPVFNKTALCILIPNQEESQRASYVRA